MRLQVYIEAEVFSCNGKEGFTEIHKRIKIYFSIVAKDSLQTNFVLLHIVA